MTCQRLRKPSPSATPHCKKSSEQSEQSHQIDKTQTLQCVRVCVYLIALGVEIEPGDSCVACLSEANELLRSVPFKHSHTAVLSSRHV